MWLVNLVKKSIWWRQLMVDIPMKAVQLAPTLTQHHSAWRPTALRLLETGEMFFIEKWYKSIVSGVKIVRCVLLRPQILCLGILAMVFRSTLKSYTHARKEVGWQLTWIDSIILWVTFSCCISTYFREDFTRIQKSSFAFYLCENIAILHQTLAFWSRFDFLCVFFLKEEQKLY